MAELNEGNYYLKPMTLRSLAPQLSVECIWWIKVKI